MPVLTHAEIDHYQHYGYLIPDQPVFSDEKQAALRQHFADLAQRWGCTGQSTEEMDKPHFWDPDMFDWLCDDGLLDMVEGIIGPDIALFTSHFIAKPAGHGRRVPWHEDSAYWRRIWDPMEVVTVWLAIDPSTRDNGCLRVIPGSHHHGFSDYVPVTDEAVFGQEIRQEQVDEKQAVDIELQAGKCSLHHAKLIHGSEPNQSHMPRCGLTMRFISARARWLPAQEQVDRIHHRNYLVRGRAHHDCAWGAIGTSNWPYLESKGLTDLVRQ